MKTKRKYTWLLTALVCAMVVTGFADDAEPVTQGCMQVIKQGDDVSETPIDLPLKRTDVQAEISGFVTRVKVRQTFTNPYSNPIEAVYVFPLPDESAVNNMTITIGDRVIEGVIKKREEARKIYEEARNAGKTAALLEQNRPNIFMQSVANIMPGNDIVVEITYDEVLKYEAGEYEFVFPMVVGPRYIPSTDQVPDASRITPLVLKPGERSGHDIMVTVKLNAGVPIHQLECPAHDVLINSTSDEAGIINGSCMVTLKPHDTVPNKDFVLCYRVAGKKPEIALLSHKAELGGYFMLMFQPPAVPQEGTVTPKEMFFVLDCSGSMSGEPMALSKKAMRYALKNLNPNDTFQVIRFSENASAMAKAPLPNTPENVRRGLSYVNGLSGGGGTRMIEGIKAALDTPLEDGRLRIVCFMTDGYIGNETEILAAIEEKLNDNTRLFSFGVGSSVNRYLLDRMAEVGRGGVQYTLLNEDPEKQVKKFYERVRNPVLTHIRIDWQGLDVEDITPSRIPDLFICQPLKVLGRYGKGGSATIRVRGKVNGKDVTYDIPVTLPREELKNAVLSSLWARARIKELMGEQHRRQNADVVKEITDLALKYSLMSQYTSFVAVEEKVVNEGGKVRTIQVPVEMPEGVSYEGVFGREQFAMAPAPRMMAGGGLAMKGLYAGRSVSGAITADYAAAPREETEVELRESSVAVDELKKDKVRVFTVEWLRETADGQERITVKENGEVWVEKVNAEGVTSERVFAGRLRQAERRQLWNHISEVIDQKITKALSWPDAGRVTVHVQAGGGHPEKQVTVSLKPDGIPLPQAWKELLEMVAKAAK